MIYLAFYAYKCSQICMYINEYAIPISTYAYALPLNKNHIASLGKKHYTLITNLTHDNLNRNSKISIKY